MNEKKEKFSAKTEIKADFNQIITKLINESPDRLKVLFDGEIKSNLIQPLFKKINESIDKTSITAQTVDFKFQDIIDDVVTNLLYDSKFASDIKDLYSSSFTDIFKSFKDIDPKSFHKQFVDQFNKKIEKSVDDLAVLKTDIKLSDINVFERDKDSSNKFKALTNKILDQLEQYTGKINISDVGITQDNLLASLFSVSPSLNANNKRKYSVLLDKTLDQISKAVDSIKLGDKGIDQTALFSIMFNDAPEMGFISRWKFNSLRESTLNILDKAVTSLKDLGGIKIEDSSLSASYLFNLLFNDTESGGFLWKWKFNSLKEEVIDILRDEVGKLEDGFTIQNTEPITTSYLFKLLFEDTEAGGFLWKRKYNSLREKVLEDLKEQVDGKFNITGDPLSTQDLIQLLFSDTPEIDTGFFGLLGPNIKRQINELREKILDKISVNIGSETSAKEDEDAKNDKDKRDHINRTVNIHEDSLKAIDKSFLESLSNADLVRETTQNKRFNQLMSFLKEDLIEAINESKSKSKEASDSSSTSSSPWWQKTKDLAKKGAKKASKFLPSAAAVEALAFTPVAAAGAGAIAGTAVAGLGLGYGIGKLIEPSVSEFFKWSDDEVTISENKQLAMFKAGKALVDLEERYLKEKKRGNNADATIERAAYDIQKFKEEEMKAGKASPEEVKKFERYAKEKLGKNIFTIKAEKPPSNREIELESKNTENQITDQKNTKEDLFSKKKPIYDERDSTFVTPPILKTTSIQQPVIQNDKSDQINLEVKKAEEDIFKNMKFNPSTSSILPKIVPKEDKIKEETQLDINQPLSVNFTPLINNLNMSFANFGRTVDTINNKIDVLIKALSENKSASVTPLMVPSPAAAPNLPSPVDTKNNIQLYRNDYSRSTDSFAIV